MRGCIVTKDETVKFKTRVKPPNEGSKTRSTGSMTGNNSGGGRITSALAATEFLQWKILGMVLVTLQVLVAVHVR